VRSALSFVLWLLTRLVVPLRYRIRVQGWEQLRDLPGPILLLPNHPGFIDPVLILTTFFRTFHPRPLLYEENFRNPVFHALMKLLQAVPVPDLDRPSSEARQRAEGAVAAVIQGLRNGDNFVLWPSGHVQHDGVERLGSARALTDILLAVPEANVLLVRTRGVWGSRFSYAYTGKRPALGKILLNSLLFLLANLLFFMPRRRVEITVEHLDRSQLPLAAGTKAAGEGEAGATIRATINRWFEAWYNAGGPEQPTFVPYHFLFGRRSYDFPPPPGYGEGEIDLSLIRPETRTAMAEILADQLGRPLTPAELSPATRLDDLGLDSLQRMELALVIERRFGLSADTAPATVGQLLALAQGLVEKTPPKPPASTWFQPPTDTSPCQILGETIPVAFLARALAHPQAVAVADELAGVLTYERLLIGASIMARRFARLPTVNVGLMLPASVACDTMLLGLYLAGKLPVLLNWTTGPANLRHAARLTGLTHVVTSKRLRDRLGIEIEGVQFLDVEDLGQQIGRFEKLRTLLTVRYLPGTLRRQAQQVTPDAHAVVLFTSGSEKAPKAVPLTHRNILSNQQGILDVLGVTKQDSVLCFLPMFHSFGLTVTTLLPLLAGIRIVHHADPTDAGGLARKIAAYRPTLLAGTPSFMEHILERAKPGELASLRLLMLGAEKCPPALFAKAQRLVPGAPVLEGYGITECAPVVAVNRPSANLPGSVGQPLPQVEVCVVDLETDEVLPQGKMGMLLVSGPNIFPGYLGEEKAPFVDRAGKRWYITGDLAELDTAGFIHFRGRLKRFLKAGGEMISLPALEEPFTQLFPPSENGPRAAVEGVETEHGRSIVLFTTEPISLKEANARLVAEGFHGVMRLTEVRRLDQIPTLGTGKVDYKQLRGMLTAQTPAASG
jgi:long-chain-fatty-acid--[acyl-carrier-protein] ligase